MSKLSPFLEGMLSVFLLVPGVSTAKPNYVTPAEITKKPIEQLTAHQPFVEVGLLMQHAAQKQRALDHGK